MRCLSASEYSVLLFCNLPFWPHTYGEIQPVDGHVGFTVAIPANPVS